MKRILALCRTGETTRRSGQKLALVALVLLLSISLSGTACGKNITGGPKYTAAQIARDLLVGEKAFLKTAVENHGAECRSFCTLATIKDAKLCVKICNGIKLAAAAAQLLEAALDAHCAGPGYLEGTAPCAAGATNEAELTQRTIEFRKTIAAVRAAEAGAQ
jgi:hypothetical protein